MLQHYTYVTLKSLSIDPEPAHLCQINLTGIFNKKRSKHCKQLDGSYRDVEQGCETFDDSSNFCKHRSIFSTLTRKNTNTLYLTSCK